MYGLPDSGEEKLQFTPFWGGLKPGWSDSVRAGIIESHNFFVIGPILVKFHIRTRLIESFPTIFQTWWCGEEKLHFTPFHTLRQQAWRSDVSTTWEGGRVSSEVRLENWTQVWGLVQIWTACDSWLRKSSTSHLFDLSRLAQTYVQYSDHVHSSRNVIFCTFERSYSSVLHPILLKLHISTRLIDSFPMVHGSWSCIEIEMLIPIGAHA